MERRPLATLLFTDIVGSTERAATLGDRRWNELLHRHREIVRGELRRYGGREVVTTGDGFLATFEETEPAIRCACAIRNAAEATGLRVRCGLHMGKIEREADDVAGIAVHIGARVAAEAAPGEVLVSSTVRDTEAGSGFVFEDRGEHVLKGVSERWRLYAVTGVPEETRAPRRRSRAGIHLGWIGAILAVAIVMVAVFVARSGRDAAEPTERSIAVLPFVNLSADPENEYFSDGMTEELINALSKIEGLKVAARTSAFSFKGRNVPVDEIGETLGVATVLEGSVRKADDRLRITAQLVDARNGYHLWSETYERRLDDVFAIQEEIARAIVSSLEIELVAGGPARLAASGTEDLDAYQLYLEGRYFWNKRSAEGLRKAAELFEQALVEDPRYARAYVGLADVHTVVPIYDRVSPLESCRRAEAAARDALELDPSLGEAYASMATIRYACYWDWNAAEESYRRGLELSPNYATLRHWYGEYLAYVGRFDESIEEFHRALELDPLSLIINSDYGWALYVARRYTEATAQLRRVLELDPEFRNAHLGLGSTLLMQGRTRDAISELRRTLELAPGDPRASATLVCAHVAANEPTIAKNLLTDLEERSRIDFVSPTSIAIALACLGESDHAFQWLERGFATRDPQISELKVDPLYDPLRGDPQFEQLLRKAGFRS